MARKRTKQAEPALAHMSWTLDTIEEEARATGSDVCLAPSASSQSPVVEYAPYPEAGPGRWQVVHTDEIVEAARDAAHSGITADMLAVLRESDFERGSLKKRLVEWRKLVGSILRS